MLRKSQWISQIRKLINEQKKIYSKIENNEDYVLNIVSKFENFAIEENLISNNLYQEFQDISSIDFNEDRSILRVSCHKPSNSFKDLIIRYKTNKFDKKVAKNEYFEAKYDLIIVSDEIMDNIIFSIFD